LVTGGSRGIGAAIARRLAESGADVAISYASSAAKAEEVVVDLTALGVRGVALQADQSSELAAVRLVEEVVERFGQLDILVHNAGVFVVGSLTDPDRDEAAITRQFTVNASAVVAATRTAVKHMPDGGRIILISSTGTMRGWGGGVGDYGASKSALEAYARSWAHELGPKGITVNVVLPGAIDTDLLVQEGRDISGVPVGRIGRPEEIAEAVAYFASPRASFTTGAMLVVDGGVTA
jgi:3-oxoacyl-[acyl-carrier protein] reductase